MDNGADALEHFLSGFLARSVDGRNGGQDCLVGVCFLQSRQNNQGFQSGVVVVIQ